MRDKAAIKTVGKYTLNVPILQLRKGRAVSEDSIQAFICNIIGYKEMHNKLYFLSCLVFIGEKAEVINADEKIKIKKYKRKMKLRICSS